MAYKKLTIKYSEDFRDNQIVGKVYGLFRDNDLHPTNVNTLHTTGLGVTEACFYFMEDNHDLPENQKLEGILQELNLNEFKIEER